MKYGRRKEQEDEEDKKKPLGTIQSEGGIGSDQGRQDAC